jgi:Uma2 family endonuclease
MIAGALTLSSVRECVRTTGEEDGGVAVAVRTRKWTLAEVHRLPDDGNKYELVRGELFVTPPPSETHETIGARLSAILTPYVIAQRLGLVYRPRAVVRFEGSEVEPDLMVRVPHPDPRGNDRDWTRAPIPILVVEILSPFTRRRDREQKKGLYSDAGVEEYWIVDPEERTITAWRRDGTDEVMRDTATWHPAAAAAPLMFSAREIFG